MFVCNTSGDYVFFPRRLCARRILSFLKRHYLEGAAHQLEQETAVFFDLSHLQYLARKGSWDELACYVTRFMPPVTELPSREGSTFLSCLHMYRVLGMIAAGGKIAEGVDRLFPLLDEAAAKADPLTAAFNAFYHMIRKRPPRDFASWLKIWDTAAETLKDLALKCPEIKGKLHLPKYAPKHWQINLSGVRPVQRPYKKKANKQKAYDIACFFKEKKRERQDTEWIPSAPEAETYVVAGTTTDGRLGSEVEDNASKSKKCKMSAVLDTDIEGLERIFVFPSKQDSDTPEAETYVEAGTTTDGRLGSEVEDNASKSKGKMSAMLDIDTEGLERIFVFPSQQDSDTPEAETPVVAGTSTDGIWKGSRRQCKLV